MSTPCDATSLISGAACLECGIPPGMENSVIISLLCQIAGVPINATSLVAGAACLECGIPSGMHDAITNYLLCQIANNPGFTPSTTQFPLTNGAVLNTSFAHALGHAPAYLRGALVCTTADTASGLAVGEEMDITAVFDGANVVPPFSLQADQTNVYVNASSTSGANLGFWYNGAAKAFTSLTHFSFKVYWK
jgi:hypothetical protein